MRIDELHPEEFARWVELRAMEWNAWPLFTSLLFGPVLFIFFWWPYVVGAIVLANIAWAAVKYTWFNVTLANTVAILSVYLQWVVAVGSAIYLSLHHSYIAGTVALAWPWLVGLLSLLAPGMGAGSARRMALAISEASLKVMVRQDIEKIWGPGTGKI